MVTAAMICGGIVALYFLLTGTGFVDVSRRTGALEFVSAPLWTVSIRILTIVVTTILYFSAAVYVEPIVAFICCIWLVAFCGAGIRYISLPFPETSVLYEWSDNSLSALTGIATCAALVLLIALTAGAL